MKTRCLSAHRRVGAGLQAHSQRHTPRRRRQIGRLHSVVRLPRARAIRNGQHKPRAEAGAADATFERSHHEQPGQTQCNASHKQRRRRSQSPTAPVTQESTCVRQCSQRDKLAAMESTAASPADLKHGRRCRGAAWLGLQESNPQPTPYVVSSAEQVDLPPCGWKESRGELEVSFAV